MEKWKSWKFYLEKIKQVVFKIPRKSLSTNKCNKSLQGQFHKSLYACIFYWRKNDKKIVLTFKMPLFLATNIEQQVANLNINVAHFGILVTHLCIFEAKFVLWNDIKTIKFARMHQVRSWFSALKAVLILVLGPILQHFLHIIADTTLKKAQSYKWMAFAITV